MTPQAITQSESALVDEAAIKLFRTSLQGELVRPDDAGYDEARKVWNGMIDRRPALIARCQNDSDVVSAINFARQYGLLVSVKGGGHSFAGHAVCEAGLVIDLSLMTNILVDPETRTARAQAGALLRDLDQATQAYGLATTAGTVSHTGIAGLTLGGGQGWLMNKHGLTIDNLLAVDIVTADGQLLTASADENTDLFWAVRGGGGNFGVVTSFTYQLHPVGPTILGGMIIHPINQAKEVLQFYREFSMNTPDEMSVAAGLLCLPDGTSAIALVVGWIGDLTEGERQVKALKEFGNPIADMIAPMPYVDLQKTLDAAVPHGMQRYAKMGYLPRLDDRVLDIFLEHWQSKTSPYSLIILNVVKGAVTRVAPEATPFVHRRQEWHLDIVAQWVDPAEANTHIDWARSLWQASRSFTLGTGVNFFDVDDGLDRIQESYGANYQRLVELKTKYDPYNFFRFNNNIPPQPLA